MFFQRILRTDPEKVFITVKNSSTTTALAAGNVVCWDFVTDHDGVGVAQATTAMLKMPAGVATGAIAAGDYGLIQVYGLYDGIQVDGSSGTTAGVPLVMQNNSYELILGASTATDISYPFTYAESTDTSTGSGSARKVFLRCL